MRVVAGTARGCRLVAPAGVVTRPTPGRVREAMFNSLYSLGVLTDARVLDLFAGSGALGIEALSRGAASAVFVENHPDAVSSLRANLVATQMVDAAQVMTVNVASALKTFRRDGQTFDLALVDPPYAFDGWTELLDRIPAPLVVIESDRVVDVSRNWEIRRCQRYGSTVMMLVSGASVGPDQCGADP